MTIAALAETGGVGVETVRYYQRRGLLQTPERPEGAGRGVRRYGGPDVRRLRFIRAAQAAGFTLEQIADLMRLDATRDRADIRRLAGQRIAALDAEIARLTRARVALGRLAHDCDNSSPGRCPIYAAFDERDDGAARTPSSAR